MTQKSPEEFFDIEALAGNEDPVVSEALEPIHPIVIIEPEAKLPVVQTVVDATKDQEEDYILARSTLRDTIEKTSDALQGILDVAGGEATPRAYEVASTMAKTVSEVVKELMGLHKAMDELKPKGDGRHTPSTGPINIDKAVFVGSTSDLLDQVRYPNG